ncbi:MAG TPA: hypothetical protein VHC43_12160 [Mycobacteriales bacterium]|nr:hypothetical protein [Mycobacteriales bacterium]
MALILDTGVLLAAFNTADPDHADCADLIRATALAREPMIVATTVLVELGYWVSEILDRLTWTTFVSDLAAGAYRYELVTVADLARAADLDAQYAALNLGLVDSTLIALCERLGEDRLATLNLRDFRAVTPRHCSYLRLLPADG